MNDHLEKFKSHGRIYISAFMSFNSLISLQWSPSYVATLGEWTIWSHTKEGWALVGGKSKGIIRCVSSQKIWPHKRGGRL